MCIRDRAYTDPGRAEALVAAAPLDFVIGSIHNLSPEAGGRDFFYLDYRSEEACYTTLDDYFASMLALTRLDCYDALGPVSYTHLDVYKRQSIPIC